MPNLILIDYDNLKTVDKRQGLLYVIEKVIKKINPPEIKGVNIEIRLYGGWYENNNLTRLAQGLSIEISANFPARMYLSDSSTSVIVRVEMAYSLISEPLKHLFHTFRIRSAPNGLRCKNP
ncbi:MAG: hypothetical protein IPJ02_01605 [Chitinophagaceae bacterium]|nr:hypothetical protein [Chitinophagaceae bacterium]